MEKSLPGTNLEQFVVEMVSPLNAWANHTKNMDLSGQTQLSLAVLSRMAVDATDARPTDACDGRNPRWRRPGRLYV